MKYLGVQKTNIEQKVEDGRSNLLKILRPYMGDVMYKQWEDALRTHKKLGSIK